MNAPGVRYETAERIAFITLNRTGRELRAPVETHVTLRTGEDDGTANEIVRIGEQTCFLHAACRSNVPIADPGEAG